MNEFPKIVTYHYRFSLALTNLANLYGDRKPSEAKLLLALAIDHQLHATSMSPESLKYQTQLQANLDSFYDLMAIGKGERDPQDWQVWFGGAQVLAQAARASGTTEAKGGQAQRNKDNYRRRAVRFLETAVEHGMPVEHARGEEFAELRAHAAYQSLVEDTAESSAAVDD